MFPSLMPQFGSAFFSSKEGGVQLLCPYIECTSHWCLVLSFWLKACIESHTRGVQLGLGLGFLQTSQVPLHGNSNCVP